MKSSPENKKESFIQTDRGITKSNAIEIPSISLPKGGGALKGIDEKFSVNAINGTTSFSFALPVSKARSLTPDLSLSYNSGAGNGIFGLGWSLSLSSIKRKTDKRLPEYFDNIDSDIFLFSEAEDLVPVFERNADGSFKKDTKDNYIIEEKLSTDDKYTIRYYRPRVEGLFARIERWKTNNGIEIKWKVTTKENVTTLYGWTAASRISDPSDESKIFEWLPEFVFDDKGNCTHYQYRKEDNIGFNENLVHHKNRRKEGKLTYTNLYIEKVLYGNKTPFIKFGDDFPVVSDFLFSTVFDYGLNNTDAQFDNSNWNFRPDAFSDYKAGFEIRTTRLCRRVLLFHHFTEYTGLVKSLNFDYDTSTEQDFTFLKSGTVYGYIKKSNGTYSSKSLPPIEFTYQKHDWNDEIKTISKENLVHAPIGINESPYQFVDLFNEGLSGILSEQANGWYYKHNLGDGKFEQAKLVTPKPSLVGLGNVFQLADLDADGGKQLVSLGNEPKGYYELDDENDWQPFKNFQQLPNINLNDPYTRQIDLNGDGKSELLITEDHVFTYYESLGRKGYTQAIRVPKPLDEEMGPHIVFADPKQTIFLADMSGDGLTDIVRIRNGEICYWANLGYGRFGAKVGMDNAPVFDAPDAFNPMYLKLADIDGSGTTDIIYLGKNKFTCWKNLSGNRFSKTPFEIPVFPEIHNQANISVTDLLGNGVACITWSSPLPHHASTLKYIDLMNSKKPHIMISYKNNMGKEVSIEFSPSTKFYIEDKLAGKPWVTKLHFPVHCVSKTTTTDKISGHQYITQYKYHHGYYDHAEREFRGFGMVEQIDAESFEHWKKSGATNIVDETLHQEPVISKQWVHTGAFLRKEKILSHFEKDFWYNEPLLQGITHLEVTLPDAIIVDMQGNSVQNLSAEEYQQALRACKGMGLRSEVFAYDAVKYGNTPAALKKEKIPYTVATHNCKIELLQPKGQNKYAVFVVKESEAITYNYERNTTDPRIAHSLNIKLDEYGNVLESASVVYPRVLVDISLPDATQKQQGENYIIYTNNRFTNDVIDDENYRLRLPSEVKTYELRGVAKANLYYKPVDFFDILSNTKSDKIAYNEIDKPLTGKAHSRLIEHIRSIYYNNNLKDALPLHQLASLALPFENYQLAYTPELLNDIFVGKVSDDLLTEGKFTKIENNWWICSGTTQFLKETEILTEAQNRFYLPISYTDPYGAKTKVKYFSDYHLLIEETEDALGNIAKVETGDFNFRTLSPQRMRDINGNLSEVISDELGLVKAMAVMGKGNEADDLDDLNEITDNEDRALIQSFFNTPKTASGICDSTALRNVAQDLLKHATARFIYDFEVFQNTGKPNVVAGIMREEHYRKNTISPVQITFEYSNGIGEVAMKKVQAEAGKAQLVKVSQDSNITINEVNTDGLLRWIGNGRTIKNNKGNPVKQYEPYFSVTPEYEDFYELVEQGVTPVSYYDAVGRMVKTDMPDGTFSKVVFDAWQQTVYDANDTVKDSDWYKRRTDSTRPDFISDIKEKQAAEKAEKHYDTPNQLHFDTLGRPILSIDHNRNAAGDDEFYKTKVVMDIEGNARSVIDAREIVENGNKGNTVMNYKYDMLGHLVYQNSMDSGQRWLLTNILGNPLRTWDERNHEFQYFYDVLHRPTESKVLDGDGATPLNHIFSKIIYGESLLTGLRTETNRLNEGDLKTNNVLGTAIKTYDTGGLIETPKYDFKGQPVATTRRLFKKYKEVANWTDANLLTDLEADTFTFKTETDALGRITKQTAPDGSVITPQYNEAGLLNGETVLHAGARNPSTYIKDIDYNEKGQRERIVYGNDVATKFEYDKETFRLKRLISKRQNNSLLQDLAYTFDAVGNITHIQDNAIPRVFYGNMRVDAANEYTYDSLYRLIAATGRENAGTLSHQEQDNWNDASFMQALRPNDPMAMRNYTQQYQYDAVGNILEMQHQAQDNNWTRRYQYDRQNNRLRSTQVGSQTYTYPHHAQHGFMTQMPHLDSISWNYKEELVRSNQQRRTDGGTPETTYYQYDGGGQRIRKITENQAAAGDTTSRKDERIYIAGYELYINHNNGLERTSLSLMDEGHRFVMIDTETEPRTFLGIPTGRTAPEQLVRYQLHNHLGSAALELDDTTRVISYEEYHPYGTTAYQARNADIKAAAKRYRYTGMERDEETGLEYHSARYYLPWLGRWCSADPIGIGDGVNVYGYCGGRPIFFIDTNGNQSYQRHFNSKIVELILASGNQQVIDRLLIQNRRGQYRLNTNRHTGFNAGHRQSGDRISASQELAIELARTNQADGTMERLNPGMSKPAVEVNIGNDVTIPVERFTARELELEGVFPEGTGNLPSSDGWTRTRLDSELTSLRSRISVSESVSSAELVSRPESVSPSEFVSRVEALPITETPTLLASPDTSVGTTSRSFRPQVRTASRVAVAGVGALMVVDAGATAAEQLRNGDYSGAAETTTTTVLSFTPAAPVVIAYGMSRTYDSSQDIKDASISDGQWWENATGNRVVGATACAFSAVGRSGARVAIGVGESVYRGGERLINWFF